MEEKVGTRGVSVDYTVIAGKSKFNESKTGSKTKISVMSVKEKYNPHTLKKSGRKGEGTHSNKRLRERNVLQDAMSNSKSKEFLNSNMAGGDTIDDEIILQKEIHSK